MRRRFVVATGSPAASEFRRFCLLLVFRESLRLDDVSGATSFELVATLRFEVATGSSRAKRTLFCLATGYPAAGRAAIPHSHLPAGIVATMRRVVNYHSSWARQQQVEWSDASGNPGSTAGRGFNPAGGAPGESKQKNFFFETGRGRLRARLSTRDTMRAGRAWRPTGGFCLPAWLCDGWAQHAPSVRHAWRGAAAHVAANVRASAARYVVAAAAVR
ncbi:hypothetical protein F511_40415 [Dorcoceras hygrometricum]|uniref:Uncharacterized protein n=1 Tax=Dorcoceras hygrometricum TaxID=472368 RepID=A0A2Z7AM63_9LAMI|nr:hypothetical protein F511_40415 [Dorcoceras hygrometricum]